MAERFYFDGPLAPGVVTLEGTEAHHLSHVCRVRVGDHVCLFNGDGREYPAEVIESARRNVTLRVLGVETTHRELGFRLEVAAPLPKGDRAQFLLEKLTELGATAFVPLHTRRSVVHPSTTRRDKLERYVVEASKQCGRNHLLQVEPLVAWEAYCSRPSLPAHRLLAHPGGGPAGWSKNEDATIAVGPEGGFTDDEVEAALAQGWTVVGLGPRILRVETAALLLASWTSSPCR
jgi:16S rRNA (uracil1498-N3)-methyltransferase